MSLDIPINKNGFAAGIEPTVYLSPSISEQHVGPRFSAVAEDRSAVGGLRIGVWAYGLSATLTRNMVELRVTLAVEIAREFGCEDPSYAAIGMS
ncbi:MAG TPA: hypothetical protein VGF37_06710 [Chthoniobacterales bacterium]